MGLIGFVAELVVLGACLAAGRYKCHGSIFPVVENNALIAHLRNPFVCIL